MPSPGGRTGRRPSSTSSWAHASDGLTAKAAKKTPPWSHGGHTGGTRSVPGTPGASLSPCRAFAVLGGLGVLAVNLPGLERDGRLHPQPPPRAALDDQLARQQLGALAHAG